MKLLLVHNAYLERAGEDAVFDAEVALLRFHDHDVIEYRRDNHDLLQMSSASAALQALWSRRTVREVGTLIARERPEVVHVHNTWPLISPSLYATVARAGVPLVQTVHNVRFACAQGMFQRNGRACEDCLGRLPWRAVWHACYRGSRAQSLVAATVLQAQRGIASRHVARWIALSPWSRAKMIEAGLPGDRIEVLPNFAEHIAPAAAGTSRAGLLFVGRLSIDKGIAVLAQALRLAPELTIDVIGDGPDASLLDGLAGVQRLGLLGAAEVRHAMHAAMALVLPSVGHESSPRVLVEAMAAALPVVASRHGALADAVDDHIGWLVPPGDAAALAATMRAVLADPAEARRRGESARQRCDAERGPASHHATLMRIYAAARAATAARWRSERA